VSQGATEDRVAMLSDYEHSELPERTKAALRLADALSGNHPSVDSAFYEELRRHLSDDQILDLGMTIAFVSGWQRFIEAFGIVPDHWSDDGPPPFQALTGDARRPSGSRPEGVRDA
jgi:alkylhydroperoxidase family enzyme